MSRLHALALCSLLATHLGACDFESHEPTDPDGGTSARTELPKVGDRVGDGSVTEVRNVGDCRSVIVTHPPLWACTAQQVDAIRKGLPEPDKTAPASGSSNLLPLSSCKDMAAIRRRTLASSLRASVDSQLQQLLQNCSPTVQYSYANAAGGSCRVSYVDASVSSPQPGKQVDGAEQYSTTNVQHEGVDEADFVKNDAGYVYVLSQSGLHVMDAWPAPETRQIAHVALAGAGTRLFLAGDRLVVYARTTPGGAPSSAATCTYGFSCRVQPEPGGTVVQVFDISSPATPRELVRHELSGGYVASRRIGNFVHTVVSEQSIGTPPDLDVMLRAEDVTQLAGAYREKLGQLEAAVAALEDAYFLPTLRTTD
ncbi:MAG TPA: beta-propeller domain-containing protein, partial [Polyangiales bacterium]|nr:beta-propeller domain-containing protein [Polyangiales bacterium]